MWSSAPSRKSPPVKGKKWKKWSGVVPTNVRAAIVAWRFIKFGAQFYLCCRQYKVLQEKRYKPRILNGRIANDTFEIARNYNLDLIYLEMFSCLYWCLHNLFLFSFVGASKIWMAAGILLRFLGVWQADWDQETGESIVFVILTIVISTVSSLPLKIYRVFVIEENYGFNKFTFGSFCIYTLKQFAVQSVWSALTGIMILWIVRFFGQSFVFWVWAACFIWLMITLAIYPNFIAPIFDVYTPLREGRLKDRLHRLAHFIGFPLNEILVLHQNLKTTHRDAYFYGLLNSKRIVLYDTLLAGYPEVLVAPTKNILKM